MKKIKQILRESNYTKAQLKIWRILNKERRDRGICEDCFRRTIELLEENRKAKK